MRCRITCLAVWVGMRAKMNDESTSINCPRAALGMRSCASAKGDLLIRIFYLSNNAFRCPDMDLTVLVDFDADILAAAETFAVCSKQGGSNGFHDHFAG